MQSSPLPCYLVPVRPKYPPQRPILENPLPTFFLNMKESISHIKQQALSAFLYVAIFLPPFHTRTFTFPYVRMKMYLHACQPANILQAGITLSLPVKLCSPALSPLFIMRHTITPTR
jgi:hypothetical protein